MIIYIKIFIRKVLFRIIHFLNKYPIIKFFCKKIINRFPRIKNRLLGMQRSQSTLSSNYKFESMSLRENKIYQDLLEAIEKKKKDK